jgi:hypothetical protein
MSTYYKSSTNTNTNLAKKQAKQKALREAYKLNKGNWEFNPFQKGFDPNSEANIKVSMKPSNGFNPAHIHEYINSALTREELICIKKENGDNLKTNEQIIYQNYTDTKMQAIKADYCAVNKQGIAANVHTKEGRAKRLLHTLDLMLKKSDKEIIGSIYLRLQESQFNITPELSNEYSVQIAKMKEIVTSLNLIELQFTRFHSQMPPLNMQGFQKLDDWQIEVINAIDQNISVVNNAPTSAGKSVLSSYTTTKGRTLFIVPTDALAWQMSAYIGSILGSNIPIITQTYQSHPSRDELIKCINNSQALVGTPDSIVDYLPFININFKWLVFDEIHMIGKPEGSAMEHIIKIIPNVPILALSATIGNTDELVDWFKKICPSQPIKKVVCSKRFFNIQRFYYDSSTDKLESLHPLALIDESQIADETILTKNLQPTPPNAWDLVMKLKKKYDIGDLEPNIYFQDSTRIELTDAYTYFSKLIKFIVCTYKIDSEGIMEIVNSYKHECLDSSSTNLINLAFKLKTQDNTPAIFFQKNTIACLRMAREFAKNLEECEEKAYPKLIQDRIKVLKIAHRIEKNQKDVDNESSKSNSKKEIKQMLGGVKLKRATYHDSAVQTVVKEKIETTSIQEPHPDFILNSTQYFSEDTVEDWVNQLKKYFPNIGEYYHFMIKLLWRGVGVYAKGLPDPYLRLVQTLACQKQLAIVFSDLSLVFGVSMPFRCVVVIRDEKLEDDLDSMLFQQMSGRAGRRGLDKEGNVIFAGYSWKRIKELSISEPPTVTGSSNVIFTIPHANKISEIYKTNQNWDNTCKNFLDTEISDEDCSEYLEGIKTNYNHSWKFGFVSDDINHLHMNWKLRYDNECLIASLILKYLNRAFSGKDHTLENNQIELAHFLCRFISTKSTTNIDYVLEDPELLNFAPYSEIPNILSNLEIDIPKLIDNRLFMSIRQNSVIKSYSEDETDILRHELLEFGEKIKHIQHFCFHSKILGLSRIIGKLLTRIWWIYHTSSPVMKPFHNYDIEEFIDIKDIKESNINSDDTNSNATDADDVVDAANADDSDDTANADNAVDTANADDSDDVVNADDAGNASDDSDDAGNASDGVDADDTGSNDDA